MKSILAALLAILVISSANAYRTGAYPDYTHGQTWIPHYYRHFLVSGWGDNFGVNYYAPYPHMGDCY